jgi:hypothetical protein
MGDLGSPCPLITGKYRNILEITGKYRHLQEFTGKLTRFSQDCETKIQAFTGKYREKGAWNRQKGRGKGKAFST